MKDVTTHVAVIPATLGYKITTISEWDDEYEGDAVPAYWWDVVIGWRITTICHPDGHMHSFTHPVTVDCSYDDGYVIRHPNGTIEEPGCRTFPTEADFVKHLREKSNGKNT